MKTRIPTRVTVFALICISGILAYFQHFTGPFQYDGVAFIANNLKLRDPQSLLTWDYFINGYFSRGLLFMSFALNKLLGGDSPFGYHLFNLLFHTLNAILVLNICQKGYQQLFFQGDPKGLENSWRLPCFTALVFLVHPIQTESVAYIISRSEVLAGSFYLAAFWVFQNWMGWSKKWDLKGLGACVAVCLIWVLGFSIKKTLITFPAIALVYGLLVAGPQSSLWTLIKRYKWILLVALLAVMIPFFRKLFSDESFLLGPASPESMVGRKPYMMTQPWVICFYYIRLLLFPFNLNVDPDISPIMHPAQFELWASLACVAVLASALYFSRYRVICLFGLFWFIAVLSPSSSIITLQDLAAEHRVYLASIGFFLAVVPLAGLASKGGRKKGSGISTLLGPTLFVGILIFFFVATLLRLEVWKSEEMLWQDAAKKSPNKVRPLINLARGYTMSGDALSAIQLYEKALSVKSNLFQPHYNLADLYMELGRIQDALQHLKYAAVLKPEVPEIQGRLGEIYMGEKEFALAERHLKRAVELDPNYDIAFLNLGVLYFYHLKDSRQARVYFKRSLELAPNQPQAEKLRRLLK